MFRVLRAFRWIDNTKKLNLTNKIMNKLTVRVMKKYFTFSMLMMSMLMFTACNDDNEDTPPSSPFTGYWDIKLDKGTAKMFFYDDGKLQHNGREYTWKYDKTTRLLSTTDNDYQWEVTLTDTTAWAGVALWGNKGSVTNYRADPKLTAAHILTNRKWEYNDTIWKFKYNSGVLKLVYESGDRESHVYSQEGFGIKQAKESVVKGQINIESSYQNHDYNGYWTGSGGIIATVSGVGNIRIDNAYSYNNVRVTCHLTYRYVGSDGKVRVDTYKDMVLRPKAGN